MGTKKEEREGGGGQARILLVPRRGRERILQGLRLERGLEGLRARDESGRQEGTER